MNYEIEVRRTNPKYVVVELPERGEKGHKRVVSRDHTWGAAWESRIAFIERETERVCGFNRQASLSFGENR